MKKTNTTEEYEQLTIDFGDAFQPQSNADGKAPTKKNEAQNKELSVGAKVTVNEDVNRFCDGRGIPDYARTAYVKSMGNNTKTILIETEPGGKELGVLFANNVSLV